MDLAFRLLTGEAIAGIRANLIPAASGLQPYCGVSGKVGFHGLILPDLSGSVGQFSRTMAGMSLGYEFFTGVDFQRFFLEFQLRIGAGTLGTVQAFQVGGVAIAAGIVW
jgi:hypothetical protein